VSDLPSPTGGLEIRRLTVLDEVARVLLLAPNICLVCTMSADEAIHAQAIWVDTEGGDVLLNSIRGRSWVRNIERNGVVTCTVLNMLNPYEYVEIRGRVATVTHDGADEHIHKLAKKYLGLDQYPWVTPDQPRILIRVTPEHVVHTRPAVAELAG
jgi:PPOX class probable F420-dependent enzyme